MKMGIESSLRKKIILEGHAGNSASGKPMCIRLMEGDKGTLIFLDCDHKGCRFFLTLDGNGKTPTHTPFYDKYDNLSRISKYHKEWYITPKQVEAFKK